MSWRCRFALLIALSAVVLGNAPVSQAAEPKPVSVLILLDPDLASSGHCIGRIDTIECAVHTFYGCWYQERMDYCRLVGLSDLKLRPDDSDRPPVASVITTRASFLLSPESAAASRGHPKAQAGWAVVDLQIWSCGGADDPELACSRPTSAFPTLFFEPVANAGGWRFVGWSDGDSHVFCGETPFELCPWYRYSDDWSEAFSAQLEPTRGIVVEAPGPIDLSQLVHLPPAR
ncbi:MAG: hypothetical protein HQ495_14905 [Alphaproteobacteria bacterium]|nr:hypothetical protein [Alphaproteobacteria bacterium]